MSVRVQYFLNDREEMKSIKVNCLDTCLCLSITCGHKETERQDHTGLRKRW